MMSSTLLDDSKCASNSHTSISVTLPVQSNENLLSPDLRNVPQMQSDVSLVLSNTEVNNILAARMIERMWMSFRDRQMFNLLKHAICAAEHSLSYEILRKISPKEAEFCKDPSTQLKVRFRFGGSEFPPQIYFKLYTNTQFANINYMSGKRVIKPASQAARDACELMGNRKFYELIIQDAIHHKQFRITDEIDVTTMKDYMQYISRLDETPAGRGGKDNSWRKLTLAVLPRTTIFYDIVDFVYGQRLSPRLHENLPVLLSRPVTQEVQLQHISVMSRMQSPPQAPHPSHRSKHGFYDGSPLSSGRQSKQARLRALKMRKMYMKEAEVENDPENTFMTQDVDIDLDLQDLDQEAHRLYEWSRDLTFDDLKTPRLHSIIDTGG